MRIYMVAFSEKGRALAEKIQNISLSVDYGNVLCEGKKVQEKTIVYLWEKEPLDVWVDLAFMQGMPLVFIGAAGIAVRAIAPFIEKKTVDSPVLVIDENAQYVVPVLSGHLGGANELARQLAEGLHGHAVVTTATDCAGCFAVDLFAKKNCLRVFDTRGIAAVSTQILQGNTVSVAVEHYSAQQLEQLRMPKELLPVDWEDFRQKKQDAMIVVTEEKELLQQRTQGSRNEMEIVFDAVSCNESFARVAVAAFITHLNPTLEELADIKTAVSEAVTNAIIHGYENLSGYTKHGEMRPAYSIIHPGKVRLHCILENDTLSIEVSDQGKGIEDVARAMEPLFTTKPELERSGMGFAFMEAFMDELEVESIPGKGTRVHMWKKMRCGDWIGKED